MVTKLISEPTLCTQKMSTYFETRGSWLHFISDPFEKLIRKHGRETNDKNVKIGRVYVHVILETDQGVITT